MNEILFSKVDPTVFQQQLIAGVLEELKPHLEKRNAPCLVDRGEMASLMSISTGLLDKLVAQDKVPSVLLGRSRRFHPESVLDAITQLNKEVER